MVGMGSHGVIHSGIAQDMEGNSGGQLLQFML
jgi:hypothetical protein